MRSEQSGTVTVPDGLYRVVTAQLCAGFVVEGGRVTMCAPILRRRIAFWVGRAQRIAPHVSTLDTRGRL